MAGQYVLYDVIRDTAGVGINGASVEVRKISDNSLVASATTATIGGIAGAFRVDETTLGYPGPIYYSVTDAVTGTVRVHTSRSTGIVGAWRAADIVNFMRLVTDGVIDGVGNELAVSADGVNTYVTVASGAAIGHGIFYNWPVARTVPITLNSSGNPRIDNIVLRFYPAGVAEEGRVDLLAVAGTPAASPVAPTPTQSEATYWEVVLAPVRVENGVGTAGNPVAASKVTDARTFASGPLTTAIDLLVTDDLTVADDTAIGGDLTVTGTAAITGATTIGPIQGAISFGGTDPTVAVNTATCGTGATATVSWGSATMFQVNITCGSSGSFATGRLCTVTFPAARGSTNYVPILQAISSDAVDVRLQPSGRTTTTFEVHANTAPSASDTINFGVFVGEGV